MNELIINKSSKTIQSVASMDISLGKDDKYVFHDLLFKIPFMNICNDLQCSQMYLETNTKLFKNNTNK